MRIRNYVIYGIIALALTMLFICGCYENYSIQIMSLSDKNTITIKRDFAHRICFLSAGENNDSFWGISKNDAKVLVLTRYDMAGTVKEQIKLPFYFSSWLWHDERAFVPGGKVLLYVDKNKIFRYVINDGKSTLVKTFPLGVNPDIYCANSQYIIAKSFDVDKKATDIYIIDFKINKEIEHLSFDGVAYVLGISNSKMKFLVDHNTDNHMCALSIYDITQGKLVRDVTVNNFFCSEAVWSPQGDKVVYNLRGRLFLANVDAVAIAPECFFDGSGKKIVTNLNFISENKIMYGISDYDVSLWQNSQFIIYDLNTKQKTQIPAPRYYSNLHVLGNYVLWDN